MKNLLFACCLISFVAALGQESKENVIAWENTSNIKLSPDGKYLFYNKQVDYTNNQPPKCFFITKTVSTGKEKQVYLGDHFNGFDIYGQWLLREGSGDSLIVQDLTSGKKRIFPHAGTYKLPETGDHRWVTYSLAANDGKNNIVVLDLETGKEQSIEHPDWFWFNSRGDAIVWFTFNSKDRSSNVSMSWRDLSSGRDKLVWEGKRADPIFDKGGNQFVFMTIEKRGNLDCGTIWYYKKGMEKVEKLLGDHDNGLDSSLHVGNARPSFNKSGDKIFFKVYEKPQAQSPDANLSKVDVWSYTDVKTHYQQLRESPGSPKQYLWVIPLADHHAVPLEDDHNLLVGNPDDQAQRDKYAVMCHWKTTDIPIWDEEANRDDLGTHSLFEYNWNQKLRYNLKLVSLTDGSAKLIESESKLLNVLFPHDLFSPKGDYVTYYVGTETGAVMKSYEIATGKKLDIAPASLVDDLRGKGAPKFRYEMPQKTWINDYEFIIPDSYGDEWKISAKGEYAPLNITKAYARRTGVKFELVINKENKPVFLGRKLLLKSVNPLTFDQGYATATLNGIEEPDMMAKGFYETKYIDGANGSFVVQRENNAMPQALFLTRDFKDFKALVNNAGRPLPAYYPQEIIKCKTTDGVETGGVLLKPADFDPGKKYPVIFTYYGGLNAYGYTNEFAQEFKDQETSPATSDMIATTYFLSHGYMVFNADLPNGEVGHPGENVVNRVVACAKFLGEKSYVDGAKIGINGQSWGGYETYYIVTHTHVFAAACATSGISDWISWHGFEGDKNGGRLGNTAGWIEGLMGCSPWDSLSLYINSSPIFSTANVTTPILIMANRNDKVVAYRHGVSFFLAMRRQGKRAWLLQYDNGDHGVIDDADQKDLGMRQVQFFDHYLKGAPAPIWMTRGVPARLKGVSAGYEIDPDIKTPTLNPLQSDDK